MLSNHHVTVALLVTPVLAVIAWFGMGWLFDERAAIAVAPVMGNAYPLVERSGCRYGGGVCKLTNNDLELTLRVSSGGQLVLEANVPLDAVFSSLGSQYSTPPQVGEALSSSHRTWRLNNIEPLHGDDTVRLVALHRGSQFFGEAVLRFMAPQRP